MNIGIFGGTFDPPHIGHLVAAQDACTSLRLDRLIFMPAAQPPHKQENQISPARVRAAMLRAAIAGDARFEMSSIELDRQGPSYTVDTLRELSKRYPGTRLTLLIGVDQAREFPAWMEPAEITRLANVVMLARGGVESGATLDFVTGTVPVTRIDVSSTLIRARVAAAEPVRYLVPDAVADIIEREGLYR